MELNHGTNSYFFFLFYMLYQPTTNINVNGTTNKIFDYPFALNYSSLNINQTTKPSHQLCSIVPLKFVITLINYLLSPLK